MKSIYCDVSSINWHQMIGRAYENTFWLIFLFLRTLVYSLSLCDLCNVIFIYLHVVLYYIVFCSKPLIFKWVLG